MNRHFFHSLSLLFLLLFLVSCKDNDDNVPTGNINPHLSINNWVYDVMKEVYYWTDDIPFDIDKNQAPEPFFESLLVDEDRFSIIVPDYDELINSLSGVAREAGYEFALLGVGNEGVVGTVVYIKPNSPAANSDLKRGDIIEMVNGKTMTRDNYQSVIGELSSAHVLTCLRQIEGSDNFELIPDISLSVVQYQENPNYLDTVYTIDGQQVGYFVYNFFADGVNINPGDNDERYSDEMDAIFADFKSKGISELILDLRYNGGGAVSAATNMASLIGSNISSDQMFYENKWNSLYQSYIEGLDDGDGILRAKFKDKEANIGSNLSRVFVLTSSRTASASELIINGLMPYMNVVVVGEKTYGKNVGSIPIPDDRKDGSDYGLLPITFKIFNSQGKSDYGDGFEPNLEVSDFVWPMLELGDTEETMLAAAIGMIKGSPVSRLKGSDEGLKPFMFSIDQKLRSNRAIIFHKP